MTFRVDLDVFRGPLDLLLYLVRRQELDITNSTLSHHLEKLKNEELVAVEREGTFLRYRANTEALEELLGFLYAECCTRNKAIEPKKIVCCR